MTLKYIISLVILLPALSHGQQPLNLEAEKEAVTKCFNDYKEAVIEGQYQKAIELVDSHSLAYYQKLHQWVLQGSKTRIDSLNIFDKLTVLLIRQTVAPEELKNHDPQKLLIHSFESGMLGAETLKENSLGEILIDGNNAQARLLVNELKTPAYYQFYKTNEGWHLDITSIFPQSAQAFKQMAKRNKMDENSYVLALVEAISGEKPKANLWEPIIR